MLEVLAQVGRTILPSDDDAPGSGSVAVLSDGYWKRRFSRDRSVVGKTFTAGATMYTIVGVMPPGFFGTKTGEAPEIWVPLSMQRQIFPWLDNLNNSMSQSSYLIGRLKPGVPPAAAASRADAFYHRFMWNAADAATRSRDNGSFAYAHVTLESAARGFSDLRVSYQLPLEVLAVIAVLVLLIACANLANLLLARASVRKSEFALRLAIGASRTRLIQQLFVESLLLALAGGAAGLLVAVWGSQGLLRMISAGPVVIPLDIDPDWRVLLFTIAASMLTSIIFGLSPALRTAQLDPNVSLKEGKGAAGARRPMIGKLLVAVQVMLSLVLLVGAGLFARTIYNLSSIDAGLTRGGSVLQVELEPAFAGYSDADPRLPAVYGRIEQKIRAISGVRAAGMANFGFGPAQWTTDVEPVGAMMDRGSSNANVVTPGYFDAVGIPIVSGRTLRYSDSIQGPKVAVVNQTFAQYFFPGEVPDRTPIPPRILRHCSNCRDRKKCEVCRPARNAASDDLLRCRPSAAIHQLAAGSSGR